MEPDRKEALAVLFEDYVHSRAPALSRFAYLVTGHRETAEDLVQQVLTDVLPKWSDLEQSVDSIDGYLRRAVINKRNTLWHRRKREVSMLLENSVEPSSPGQDTEERAAIWQAVLKLNERRRTALVLRIYEDMTYTEVAATMSCRESTARSLVRRALHQLKPLLEEEGDINEQTTARRASWGS